METPGAPPGSVFILKPSSFGDIIHTLPAVARLKSVWRDARFTWLVNTEWVPLIEGNPDLASIVPFPRSDFRGWGGWRRFYRWQRQHLAGRGDDLVLDFQGLLRSAVVGRLSAPRSFYGASDAREGARWFYDRIASMPPGTPHAVERYLALARFALEEQGWPCDQPDTVSPRFPLPSGDPLDAETAARLTDDFILLHPFARGQGKSLTMAQVERCCAELAPRQVVLVGRREPEQSATPAGSLDLLGRTTLRQLIWLLRHAAFVISVDSGPAHLAAALDRPMVAIHTWSDPRRVGPYPPNAWVWKSGRLIQTRALATVDASIFRAPPQVLTASQIHAICALATSPSDSCA